MVEIESCSKYTDNWDRYWTIGLATKPNGDVIKEAQGLVQSAEDIEALLSGRWGHVDWIEVMQSIELHCYDIEPDHSASYSQCATLTAVKKTNCTTMQMLHLAKSTDRDNFTAAGFMERIIELERRSRALPEGSVARDSVEEELVAILKEGLNEFGKRWADQFKVPVNYMEPMAEDFSHTNCSIYNRLDTAEDTANKVFQFRHVLKKKDTFLVRERKRARESQDYQEGPTLPAHKDL